MEWTAEIIDQLRALWPTNSAAKLALRFNTTKSAVIGKAHRLDLPRKEPIYATPDAAEKAARRARARKLAKLRSRPTVNPRASTLSAAHLPTIRLRTQPKEPPMPPEPAVRTGPIRPCQWPHGEPGRPEFRFCEDPSEPGRPYCTPHCAVAYSPFPNWSHSARRAEAEGAKR